MLAEGAKQSIIYKILALTWISIILLGSIGFNIYLYGSLNETKIENSELYSKALEKAIQYRGASDLIFGLNEQINQLNTTEKYYRALTSSTLKYLSIQKEKCDTDPGFCIDQILARSIEPKIIKAEGGLCVVRAENSEIFSEQSPNTGTGYAKITKKGINSIKGLQKSCNENDYISLMQSYCQQNYSLTAKFEVAQVNTFGGITNTDCASTGCGFVICPKRSNL